MQRVADCAKTILLLEADFTGCRCVGFFFAPNASWGAVICCRRWGTLREGNYVGQAIPGDPRGFEAHPGQIGRRDVSAFPSGFRVGVRLLPRSPCPVKRPTMQVR